ncbi:uncharacterized protein LOC143862446 [Tasmannia lanceolata]|uniref:uncharacterized protein LOC143862446 n=1 Tax=Tasmannia lanceolata TaxID=3420 RepID=UPI0040648AD9
MARVSSDLEFEEEEVELSLGLSIGGNFRKTEKSNLISQESITSHLHHSGSYSDMRCLDLERRDLSFSRSDVCSPLDGSNGLGSDFLDQEGRREMQAIRRREARMKREEKQHKKGGFRGRNVNNHLLPVMMDDRTVLEAERFQSRVRDRAVKEEEACWLDQRRRFQGIGGNVDQNVTLSLSPNQILNPNPNPNPDASSSACPAFPVMSMQYPYHPMQYMPFSNGFTFPYMMPCWAPPSGSNADKNVFVPEACRNFRPYQASIPNTNQPPPSCDSEQNGNNVGGIKQRKSLSLASSGSLGSNSSAVSDNQSASLQGGTSSSSDTRSHSSHPPLEQLQPLVDNAGAQFRHSLSNHHIESCTQVAEETTHKHQSNTAPSSPKEPLEPVSTTKNPDSEDKKPLPCPPSLTQMPCVSTTGNGPNGKTITGFLYRYTKTEVSIVCVCHGRSFSPEEFVKHAGGTDISHPLKHILVVPSTFG